MGLHGDEPNTVQIHVKTLKRKYTSIHLFFKINQKNILQTC